MKLAHVMKNQHIRIPRCPRCGTRGVSVEVKSSVHFRTGGLHLPTVEQFGECGICKKGVIRGFVTDANSEYILPLINADIPEHLPDNVERVFRQGVDNVEQGNWDAAGGMFRKTLENALRHRFSDNASCSLADRIKKAAENRNLTPEMAEWANQIRFWGNNAAHEDEPFTEEDARQMGEFTELFLTYLFTLPEKLAMARDQK